MAVLNLLHLQALDKQEPAVKTEESILNDNSLHQLKKKALKKLQKYEQQDQEEDDNEDLAYLNFALIWPETAQLYTLAAVILHNFLRDPVEEEYLNFRFPDDRRMLIDQRAPEAGRQGRLIRDRFVDVVIRGVQDVV